MALIGDLLIQGTQMGVAALSARADVLPHLTIRQYLGIVFAALVLLLLVLAIWP
ncbi:hypothetical protein V5F44_14480 [Xanthobacter sp. V2C-8]|uniref:hypothetical protein n=1 Tax=Xanthobacter albus TaxID=3119929 RepID=UPI00372BF5C6